VILRISGYEVSRRCGTVRVRLCRAGARHRTGGGGGSALFAPGHGPAIRCVLGGAVSGGRCCRVTIRCRMAPHSGKGCSEPPACWTSRKYPSFPIVLEAVRAGAPGSRLRTRQR
jgi:hypothetical protein